MNSVCLFTFLISFLILLLVIIILCANLNPVDETFENIPNNYKEKIINYIKNDLKHFHKKNFDPNILGDFYQNNMSKTILVNIDDNGEFTMTYSKNLLYPVYIEYIKKMLNLLKKIYKKLPKCLFVISIGDESVSDNLPIFQNSVFKEQNAVMSPLWYWISETKIDSVKNNLTTPWDFKNKKAIWRGSSTGYSGQDYRSGRKISRKYVVDTSSQYPELIDAAFTNLVQKGGENLENQKYNTKPTIDPIQQTKYKYIITMDGNGGTYGLYWTLSSGCCPLNNTQYKQWFSPFFEENKHFITFSDIEGSSNLHNIISHLRQNDEKARKIAKEAQKTARIIFNRSFVLFYMYKLIQLYSEIQNS